MRLFIAFVTIVALMAVALMPLNMALAQEANPSRVLPADTVERGQTFDVTVTFAAPADKFNAIGLTDLCPDGWDVTIDEMWSNPSADAILATDNKAEIAWFGEPGKGFDSGTSFSVVYQVAVPDYACAGKHTFDGFLEYYLASEGPYVETVTGDSEVEVSVAATPLICCNPKSFTFSATEGGSNPADQTLEISNSGIGTINWALSDDAAWLSEGPTSGSSTGEHDTVAVSVDITGMSAGDYSASITITADEAINSPWTVPVSLHISSSAPQISFNPESRSFTAAEGGSNPAKGVLEIWNSGVDMLNWSLSDDAAWLSEDPTSGSSTGEHDTVAVSVDITGMSAGDYSASITITADDASNSPRTVPISLHISSAAPQISFKPGRFSFAAVEGGPTHAAETLEIWNSGVDTLHWSLSDDAAWLSEDPTSGSSTGEHDAVVVSVDIAGMPVGDYSTSITITAEASNSPQVVPVSLHISSAAPQISFTPESLNFTAVGGGPTPPDKPLGIWNAGIEILNWSVSDDAEWLSENPTSGNSTGPRDTTSVTVSVNTAGMSDGNYSANITITSPGAGNSPQTVLVNLHVGEIGPPLPPSQPWLSRYWWTIVVGIVVVVLLAYFLWWRKRVA